VTAPLLFGALVALSVLVGFVGLWRTLASRDPLEARLQEYGAQAEAAEGARTREGGSRRAWPGVNRLLAGLGLGPRLATALSQADVAWTAAEFALVVLAAALLGYLAGTWRSGLPLGVVLALLFGCLPLLYLNIRRRRRRNALTAQLPDVLSLLVGALRTGYGLSQAMEMLVEQVPPPTSTELARATRAVRLGQPIHQALIEMAGRVGTDDFDLVVTAMNVQYEMGGNLAETLGTISETVRDRIRIKRQIRTLTAQQRFTGYFLAVWPLLVGLVIYLLNPEYIKQLFVPGWLLLPVLALVMQVIGFLVILRIVDIEV